MPDEAGSDKESSEPAAATAKVALEERHPPFAWVIRRFHLNLDALREMLDEFVPQLEEFDAKRLGPAAISAVRSLPEDRRKELRKLLETTNATVTYPAGGQDVEEDAKHPTPAIKHGRHDSIESTGTADERRNATTVPGEPAAERQDAATGPEQPRSSLEGVEPQPDKDSSSAATPTTSTDGAPLRAVAPSATAADIPTEADPEVQRLRREMSRIFADDPHSINSFLMGLTKAMAGPRRVAIIRNSLLAQAISAFEVLVSGIVTRYFILHPDALEASGPEFSLADLRKFEDIDDATDVLIARRVSSLMYGSLDDWGKWFQSRAKVSFEDLAIDWEKVREAFQRRHVIIHNGGLVSRQYLANVQGADSGLKVGDRLTVDDEYLSAAIDQIDALGTAVAGQAWGAWVKDERDASAGEILRRSYELMLEERWEAVEKLTSMASFLKSSAAIVEPLRCNHWYSRLERHGAKSIQKDVEAWDTSALAGRFQLVQTVLLEDFDRAAKMVPGLIASKQLQVGELYEWPILSRLRASNVFGDLEAQLPGTKVSTTSDDKETMDH